MKKFLFLFFVTFLIFSIYGEDLIEKYKNLKLLSINDLKNYSTQLKGKEGILAEIVYNEKLGNYFKVYYLIEKSKLRKYLDNLFVESAVISEVKPKNLTKYEKALYYYYLGKYYKVLEILGNVANYEEKKLMLKTYLAAGIYEKFLDFFSKNKKLFTRKDFIKIYLEYLYLVNDNRLESQAFNYLKKWSEFEFFKYYILGLLLNKKNKQALDEISNFNKIFQNLYDFNKLKVKVLIENNKLDLALMEIYKLLAQREDEELHYDLLKIYQYKKLYSSAVEEGKYILENYDVDDDLLIFLASCYINLYDFDNVRKMLELAKKINPDNWQIYYDEFIVEKLEGNIKKETLDKLKKLAPANIIEQILKVNKEVKDNAIR